MTLRALLLPLAFVLAHLRLHLEAFMEKEAALVGNFIADVLDDP
jgi:hypothetical protein